MQKETAVLILVISVVAIISMFLFVPKLFPQSLDPITELWGYELTFYSVEYDDSVLTVTQGDTLQIRWDAPTTRMPYDEQPDYPLKGNWTGVFLRILVKNDSVDYNGDIWRWCNYIMLNRLAPLAVGKHELTIRAIDLNDKFSKESEGFIFEVIEAPPGVPARVYIIVGK